MPEVSTREHLCRGHDGCGKRKPARWSENVSVGGILVAREGDTLEPHGCGEHPLHGATITRGWPTVTVNNKPIAYVGAAVSCASMEMGTGDKTVTVG